MDNTNRLAEAGDEASFKYSFFWKIILPIPFLLILLIAGFSFYLPQANKKSVLITQEMKARDRVEQLKTLRRFYTEFVVKRAKATGSLKPGPNYKAHTDQIPAPTTFLLDYAEKVVTKERINIYSPYPWPNRTSRKMDDFQKRAWQALSNNPEGVVEEFFDNGDKKIIRVAMADRLTESCVQCHNTHPDSPKRGWKVGDVRGIIEITDDVTSSINAAQNRAWYTIIALIIFSLATIYLLYRISKSIAFPFKKLAINIQDVLDGALHREIKYQKRTDEVGVIARSIAKMQSVLRERKVLEDDSAEKTKKLNESFTRLRDMADMFDKTVGQLVQHLSNETTTMREACVKTTDLAHRSSKKVASAEVDGQNMKEQSDRISRLGHEMSTVVSQIGSSAENSRDAAQNAATEAKQASDVLTKLSDSTQSIGEIVGLIRDVAEQTNLLALNATIEAARAGDAGKGFSVVASEVKQLADRTSKATIDISNQTDQIYTATREAITAISSISETITSVAGISADVASQTVTQRDNSNELSASITQSASSTTKMISETSEVAQMVKQAEETILDMQVLVDSVKTHADCLLEETSTFAKTLRNA